MDFDFSKDQKMIQASAREFLEKECPFDKVRELEDGIEGFDREMWKKMADLGWMGIIFPEEYYGTGGDLIDLMILMEEMGRKLLPSPFFATMALCALPILKYGQSEQKGTFLPAISEGEKIWTLALTESTDSYAPSQIKCSATFKGKDYRLSGTKLFVPYAQVADHFLVVAKREGDEMTVFIVGGKTPGIAAKGIPTTAHDKLYEVEFEDVAVPQQHILGDAGTGKDIVNFILQEGAILKCAEMVGAIQAAFEITNDYAKKRTQFDRPIGSFQAIQHKLADMLIDIEGLRYLVYEAAWRLSIGSASELLISMAKAKANEVYQRACIECMRVHGAIGFTREHDIGLYHLRTKAWEFALGDSFFHKERIAGQLEQYMPPISVLR